MVFCNFFLLDISSFSYITTLDENEAEKERIERENVFEILYAGKYCIKFCTNITKAMVIKNELSFSHILIQNYLEDLISSEFDMNETIHACSCI